MSKRLVARRYAKALAGIAQDQDTLLQTRAELAAVAALVRGNADLERLAFYPLLAPALKAKALDAVLAAAGISATVRRFFGVVAGAARLDLVYELASAFDELVDERMGVVKAAVLSVRELGETQKLALTAELTRLTGLEVRCEYSTDAALVGGVAATIGSRIYDGSVRGELSVLRRRLAG